MLEARKFAANVVTDGEAGLDHLLRRCYDAAVIDVGLPGMDGFSLARNARAEGRADADSDAHGARRRRGSRRRTRTAAPTTISSNRSSRRSSSRASRRSCAAPTGRCVGVVEAGALRIDLAARIVTYEGKPVDVGRDRVPALEFLARNAGIALSRAQIVERIWDYDFDGSSNIVDVYVEPASPQAQEDWARAA